MKHSTKKILEYFSRTTEDVYSQKELEALLESGKKIRIKFGFDITAPFLHIGHGVSLWMIRYLQEQGHKAVLLAGDFTTSIGDPTGEDKTRPVISEEVIQANAEKYLEQVKMILLDDPEVFELHWNSDWYSKMPLSFFINLLSKVTHANLISRDMFRERIKNSNEIHMHEMLYPILQGYDSVELKSDLTIIGSDQLFNENMGRLYQEKSNQKPQVIITVKLLPGLDGQGKMSKSKNNYIGLGHSSRDKFGLTMTLPDNLIVDYLRIYTDVPLDEIEKMKEVVVENPIQAKKFLASKIVERYHGVDIAEEEQAWFEETFSSKKAPTDIPNIEIKDGLTYFNVLQEFYGDAESNSNIRRLFEQGAVSVNEEKKKEHNEIYKKKLGDVFRVGKRTWFKVK
ncbi:tyrosine--tRNA ligase [Patescibacteria group bacterium]|nr:tyrosine--tRNA ligase [Patescibacteria group bacterium]